LSSQILEGFSPMEKNKISYKVGGLVNSHTSV
jgi:hypothetical protein